MRRDTPLKHYVGLFVFVCFAIATLKTTAIADVDTAQSQIKAVISSIYDKPDAKVEADPIVVSGDYAVADWIQGNRGGRALLHRINGKWTIAACGANDLQKVKTLTDAGIPLKTAKALASHLSSAEKNISQERLKMFSLFGTKDDPASAEHHHNHTH